MKKWLTILAASLLAICFLVAPISVSAAMSTYDEVKYYISNFHVSGIPAEQLTSPSIEGMIKQLNDPYTVYFTQEEANSFTSSINQNYVGIGVRINDSATGVYVVEVFKGSPAEAAGILPGDIFYSVNDVPAKGKKTDVLVNEVKGPEGTTVKLVMLRNGKLVNFQIPRKPIQIPVVNNYWFKDGKVGYLNISSFSSNLKEDVSLPLAQFEKNGMKSLIIDLRNNPGGYLNAAKDLAEFFYEKGILIHTKDRDANDNPIYFSNGRKVSYKILLLVNENSASASEVFTGVIQDYKIGTVIGTKTFGKGSVQQLINLTQSNGGMLKLTVEEYLTPLKRKVNGTGLLPDTVVQGNLPQWLTTMNLAGANPISLKLTANSTVLNGYSMSEKVTKITKNATTYIPTRVAAALLHVSFDWNAALATVTLTSPKTTKVFNVKSNALIVEKGTTYVSLKALKLAYPGFSFSTSGNDVTVTYKKG